MLTNKSLPLNFKTNIRWLITGGCGFIGTSLIKVLNRESRNFIRILDNLSVGSREDLGCVCNFNELDFFVNNIDNGHNEQCELFVGDIKDYDMCLKLTENIDVVIHLAAETGVGPSVENPRADMEANIFGTFNMLEAARKNNIKGFVFASSGAPVGECEPPIHEELAAHPNSPYGASKLAGEGYCSAYYRTFGLRTVSLRFGNVYGPGSKKKQSVIAKFIKQALKGEVCEIYGDGKQSRDFIYIEDLVDAIQRAVNQIIDLEHANKNFPWGEAFQIASNQEHTINEVANILKTQLIPHGIEMKIKNSDQRPGDVKRNYSDTNKAKHFLNWETKVDLFEGIQKTVDWFLEQNKVSY